MFAKSAVTSLQAKENKSKNRNIFILIYILFNNNIYLTYHPNDYLINASNNSVTQYFVQVSYNILLP